VFNIFLLIGALQEQMNGPRSIIGQALVGAAGLGLAIAGRATDPDDASAPAITAEPATVTA